jgi:hypothetical protein
LETAAGAVEGGAETSGLPGVAAAEVAQGGLQCFPDIGLYLSAQPGHGFFQDFMNPGGGKQPIWCLGMSGFRNGGVFVGQGKDKCASPTALAMLVAPTVVEQPIQAGAEISELPFGSRQLRQQNELIVLQQLREDVLNNVLRFVIIPGAPACQAIERKPMAVADAVDVWLGGRTHESGDGSGDIKEPSR